MWEPIPLDEEIPTANPDGDGRDTVITVEYDAELWGTKQTVMITSSDNDGMFYASITLPDDVRLCRSVQTEKIAREFIKEVMRRADNNGDGDAHPYGIGIHFANVVKEWEL